MNAQAPVSVLRGDFVYRTATPLTVASAKGVRLLSACGKTIIDLHAASGTCMLGYRDDLLQRGVAAMAGLPSKPQFCESQNRIDLARRLGALMAAHTGAQGKIGFDLGGAQGIEQALKVVSARDPSANIIFTLDGAYHGRSIATSYLSCSARYLSGPGAGVFKNVRLPVPALKAEELGCDLATATAICVKQVTALFSDERLGLCGGPHRFHSFLFEPLLNVAGMVPIALDYLRLIIGLVRAGGGAVIADEIFTGYFKTASVFGCAPLFPSVDIVVMSKFLTNGIAPLSAIWVADASDLAATYAPGIHSSTYINNEFAVAVGLETLSELAALDTAALGNPGRLLAGLFQDLPLRELGAQGQVFDNVAKITMPDRALFDAVQRQLAASGTGVLMATTGLARNTFIFHPAFTTSAADMAIATEVLGKAMRACA